MQRPNSGGSPAYVNWSAALVALVPPGVVTVTCSVPLPAGDTAVIDVLELTVKLCALLVPNLTAVAPVKPVPTIDTLVPPPPGPVLGVRPVTVGTGR